MARVLIAVGLIVGVVSGLLISNQVISSKTLTIYYPTLTTVTSQVVTQNVIVSNMITAMTTFTETSTITTVTTTMTTQTTTVTSELSSDLILQNLTFTIPPSSNGLPYLITGFDAGTAGYVQFDGYSNGTIGLGVHYAIVGSIINESTTETVSIGYDNFQSFFPGTGNSLTFAIPAGTVELLANNTSTGNIYLDLSVTYFYLLYPQQSPFIHRNNDFTMP